ncbi:hypothetical protein NDU88_002250 [Pleurodeles waltl]|uniref:Uncharacterized protein n=1 Tax=Pleurodeles waltl TaxID=8319 RepID=A0AAV7NGK3_PLEWA|nr:hypothetical protein NDU88_002250 [Pleurodeles waltl]
MVHTLTEKPWHVLGYLKCILGPALCPQGQCVLLVSAPRCPAVSPCASAGHLEERPAAEGHASGMGEAGILNTCGRAEKPRRRAHSIPVASGHFTLKCAGCLGLCEQGTAKEARGTDILAGWMPT